MKIESDSLEKGLSDYWTQSEREGLGLTKSEYLVELKKSLGKGPERFAPDQPEREIQEQLDELTEQERECYEYLVDEWDEYVPACPLPERLVLRYARNSPGSKPFHKKKAWKTMKRLINHRGIVKQLSLRASDVMPQLQNKTLFPVPGLKTKEGSYEVFYFRHCRFEPTVSPVSTATDNLAFCLNSMYEKESVCKQGVAFITNMDGWKMKQSRTEFIRKVSRNRVLVAARHSLSFSSFQVPQYPTWPSNSRTRQSLSDRESCALVR